MAEDRTSEFAKRDPTWRIEAVIHDGSWYTVRKWAKLSKVKDNDIHEWIENNKEKTDLIHMNDSYRLGYDEIMRWYDDQPDIELDDRLVPNNFPPKIWDGQTEAEALINVPKRQVTEVSLTPNTKELKEKCQDILRGTAILRLYKHGSYRACGLSRKFIISKLQRGLTREEFEIVNPGRKTIMHYRELSDFSEEFLENALKFYVPFAKTLLRSRMSTLKIYLPTQSDIDMQVAIWIMTALRKFDEQQPVPFSGYLSRVLSFWPYDLPDEILGKELSTFQRNKRKIMNKWIHETGDSHMPDDEIISRMKIDKDTYLRLTKEYQSWLYEHNATQLTWENSSNEKMSDYIWDENEDSHNSELSHKIAIGLMDAALKTENFSEAFKIINTLGSVSEEDYASLQNINNDFKQYLWEAIQAK